MEVSTRRKKVAGSAVDMGGVSVISVGGNGNGNFSVRRCWNFRESR